MVTGSCFAVVTVRSVLASLLSACSQCSISLCTSIYWYKKILFPVCVFVCEIITVRMKCLSERRRIVKKNITNDTKDALLGRRRGSIITRIFWQCANDKIRTIWTRLGLSEERIKKVKKKRMLIVWHSYLSKFSNTMFLYILLSIFLSLSSPT